MRPAELCDPHVVPSVALQASSVRPTTQQIITTHILIEKEKIEKCLHPLINCPHLTRLFPHPCIFTLSCQLLNHLFQPLEEAQIRNIPSEKESRPGDLGVQPPPRRQLQLQLALHLPDLHLQTPDKRDIYCNSYNVLTLRPDWRHCHDRDSQRAGSVRPTALSACSSPPAAPAIMATF